MGYICIAFCGFFLIASIVFFKRDVLFGNSIKKQKTPISKMEMEFLALLKCGDNVTYYDPYEEWIHRDTPYVHANMPSAERIQIFYQVKRNVRDGWEKDELIWKSRIYKYSEICKGIVDLNDHNDNPPPPPPNKKPPVPPPPPPSP
jgi:hypothetical protein